ncbi:hypothetical protein [Amycolatopsis sp. CA-126428]|uniref:hypothetical protein n=1 Tax=Amycolatopsis sp. CA-126428 TaxID=2073158 RepID=UPI0011B04625|nr:hypothetical protein [Amycolatopsis sp. CA-126428]
MSQTSIDCGSIHVEPGELISATIQIQNVMDHDSGKKISGLCGDAGEYGNEELRDAFFDFCQAWQTGIDFITEDGRAMASLLSSALNAYLDADLISREEIDRLGRLIKLSS